MNNDNQRLFGIQRVVASTRDRLKFFKKNDKNRVGVIIQQCFMTIGSVIQQLDSKTTYDTIKHMCAIVADEMDEFRDNKQMKSTNSIIKALDSVYIECKTMGGIECNREKTNVQTTVSIDNDKKPNMVYVNASGYIRRDPKPQRV